MKRGLHLRNLIGILLPLHANIAQILALHYPDGIGADGSLQLLLTGLLRLPVLAILDLGAIHAKIEFVGVPHRRLLSQRAQPILLLVVVARSDAVVLLFLQDAQVRSGLGLGPLLVRDALHRIAKGRHGWLWCTL